eukprot:3485179-Pyramimonas_sp.AAC.1
MMYTWARIRREGVRSQGRQPASTSLSLSLSSRPAHYPSLYPFSPYPYPSTPSPYPDPYLHLTLAIPSALPGEACCLEADFRRAAASSASTLVRGLARGAVRKMTQYDSGKGC